MTRWTVAGATPQSARMHVCSARTPASASPGLLPARRKLGSRRCARAGVPVFGIQIN